MPHYDATSLPRLMQCGASRSMPAYSPTVGMDQQSEDAREGIAAHWLATGALTGRITDLDEWIDRKAPNGVYISYEMVERVRWYVTGVTSNRGARAAFTETDMKAWNSDGSITIGCRPDYLCDDLADYGRRIYVDDFKYGWRIVEVENNWTLVAHACAYIADKRVDADTVFEFRIWQPRPYHPAGKVRPWIVHAAHLFALREYMFNTLAASSSTLQTGPYCYRCPSRSFCPAVRKASMSLLDVTEQAIPDNMTLDDLSMMMDALTVADHTLKQYKDAIQERIVDALNRGEVVRNYRMKPYDGDLAWVDGIDETALSLLTTKPVSKPAPLLTPTQLKKVIPEVVLKQITYRKPGGTSLKRIDVDQEAETMFGTKKDTVT